MDSLEIFHSATDSQRWNRHIHAMMETVKRTQNPYVLAFTLKFAARFYFKQKQFQTAITLVNKALQIYPANHRLRKSTLFDLYRYQMVDARKNDDKIAAEEFRCKLKELESELRGNNGYYVV
jgi:tetratricopeptide (TPR) repeat protein